MDPAVRFADLVNGPQSGLQLDRACALLAAGFTGTDRSDEVCARLDDLAAQVGERSLDGVLAAMRGRLAGNRTDYYDPRNSYLDDVLERGLGLPITLSVVAIEVGRRVDVPLVGIGLPSHFLVRDGSSERYGDPFHDGARFDRAGMVAAWHRLVGEGHTFDEWYLAPVSERAILIRMLNNLRGVFARTRHARARYALSVMRGAFVELAHEQAEHARWVQHLN
jgi:regulator of sirC expression with transglutaminase-like and TPR domain